MNPVKLLGAAGVLLTTAGIWSVATPALATGNFYEGKTIKMIVRSAPGGGYDFYGRLMARHMPRHIPGNPKMIVINMPGAGGIVAANYLMNRAKRDGTEMGALTRELTLAQRTGAVGVKYDINKMPALGSAASSTFLVVMSRNHPVKTYAQLKKHGEPVLFATTGPGAGSYQYPSVLKYDGFPIKIISGIVGGQSRFLSMERGETHATANSYESTQKAIKEFGLVPILYSGAKHPDLKDVPHIGTQLSPKGKQLAALLGAPLAAGRPFFTAPETPADRVTILRTAFKAALEDPQLIKEAGRAKRNVSWTSPEEMASINREILTAPDDVVALYKEGSKKPKKSAANALKHAGAVVKIERKGRRVWIDHKGKNVMAKISGSRTKITVAGAKAKRKAIKMGMNCRFTYPGPGEEASNVDCK